MRVSIEGLIGSGKTELIRRLASKYPVYEENVNGWIPYLNQFYRDPNRWALTLSLKVLVDFSCIPKNAIVERSPLTAKRVFFENMQADLADSEVYLYKSYYDKIGWDPDAIIYINTPLETCYERIQERGRVCELSITRAYLEKIHARHEDLLNNTTIPVYRVDGGQSPEKVVDQTFQLLHGPICFGRTSTSL